MPAIHLLISALYNGICVHVAYTYYLFLLTFPICIFPSSFFMRLTFSSISSSISYLPEYGPAPWKEVVHKDCHAHNLNKEDAMMLWIVVDRRS